MPQPIKEEDLVNDGRWTTLPDIGSVRTGPRGKRYWDAVSQQSPGPQSTHFDDPMEDADDRFTPMIDQEMSLMARFSDEQRHRRQTNPDNVIGPIGSVESAYTDSRRAPIHNKPLKRIKDEEDSESNIFFSDQSIRQFSTPSSPPSSSRGSTTSSIPVSDGKATTDRNSRPTGTPHTPPTPPGSPPQYEPQLPPGDCQCPIHLQCPARGGHLIDCRILVPVWQAWRAAQEEYDPLG